MDSAVSYICPAASSSVDPVSLSIDHSSPSGLDEATSDNKPPITTVATPRITSVVFNESFAFFS